LAQRTETDDQSSTLGSRGKRRWRRAEEGENGDGRFEWFSGLAASETMPGVISKDSISLNAECGIICPKGWNNANDGSTDKRLANYAPTSSIRQFAFLPSIPSSCYAGGHRRRLAIVASCNSAILRFLDTLMSWERLFFPFAF
jgi:hypothetical protein